MLQQLKVWLMMIYIIGLQRQEEKISCRLAKERDKMARDMNEFVYIRMEYNILHRSGESTNIV